MEKIKFDGIEERLAGMIRIPTVNGSCREFRIDEYKNYLKAQFDTVFDTAAVLPVKDALLCRIKGSGGEAGSLPVLFTGHMDVVAAKDSDGWDYPPFSGTVTADSVWGRGSQDMKGPQCALLSAFDRRLKTGWRPVRDVWLYLSCDEETGGAVTCEAARVLEKKGIRFETVFDEGGTICEDFMGLVKGRAALFGVAEKGSLEYRFTSAAEGGHAAAAPRNSAIVKLAGLINEAEGGAMFHRELSPAVSRTLRAAAEYCTVEETRKRLRAASEDREPYTLLKEVCPQAESMLGATIAFTMIQGGTAFNVMPIEAVLTANVRVSSVETEKEVTEKLKARAERHGVCCELAGGTDASFEGSEEGFGYRVMKASVNEAYPGLPVIPFVLGGGTDSKHFCHITDEILRFSPLYSAPFQGRGVHGENESVFIEALKEAARCYDVLLGKL